jgi:hypothetical protein
MYLDKYDLGKWDGKYLKIGLVKYRDPRVCIVTGKEPIYSVGFGTCNDCNRLHPVYTDCNARDFVCEECLLKEYKRLNI